MLDDAFERGTRRLGDAGGNEVTSDAGAGGRPTVVDDYDVEARIEAAVSAVGGDEEPDADPLIGRLIENRFEVISRLGAGGMGVVYRARQVGIDRVVAVKTLLKDRAQDQKTVQRFKNEARAVSRLNHPNTIRIHDFGQMEDGTLYFAMELLEGRSLDKAIRQDSPFSARRTLHILNQMAESLAEAHAKGIVHRDLKPENVYLCHVGDDPDFVKVLDFGVAKLRESDRSQGTVTQAGVIFGTPRYMAPEQCRTMAVDARADIYALGIICYEMLVGRTPFDADNPLALLMKHLQDAVPPMASVRPDVDVPPDVEALIRKCLEKSPERRFQSASALAADVRTLTDRLDGRYERVVFVEKSRQPTVQAVDRGVDDVLDFKASVSHSGRRWAFAAIIALLVLLSGGLAVEKLILKPERDKVAAAAKSSQAASDEKKRQATSRRESPASTEPVKSGESAGTAAAAAATSPTVSVRLDSEPTGATVFRGETELGKTPLSVELARSDEEFAFEFVLDGYRSKSVNATLSRDVSLSAVLVANAAQKQAERRPAKQTTKQAASISSTPAQPEQAGKLEKVESTPVKTGFEKVGGEVPARNNAPNKVGDLKKF